MAGAKFIDALVIGLDRVWVERTTVTTGKTETVWAWQALTDAETYVFDHMIEEARYHFPTAELRYEFAS